MKKTKGFAVLGAIIGVLVAVLIGIAGFLVIDGNNKAVNWDDYDFATIIEGTKDNGYIGDHIKGDPNAPVVIVEYADYQCEWCASINPRVNKLVDQLDGKLAVVYRSYLLSYHQNATAAASAVEAAGLQGYWKDYATKMFEMQEEWRYASSSERKVLFENYFKQVTNGEGDVAKFNEDLASDAVFKKVNFDCAVGRRVGIEGTPAFYIDGQLIRWSEASEITINGKTIKWDSGRSGDEFSKLIKDIVAAKLGEK